jgi:pimeloyl-ACP methyl ester carboxylesterase
MREFLTLGSAMTADIAMTLEDAIALEDTMTLDDAMTLEKNLLPWEFRTHNGLLLKGWRSPPSGKPLVTFLHGNGFCGAMYWPFLRRCLNAVDWVLLDLPGHGDSDPGERFLGWNENAELAWHGLKSIRHHYPGQPVYAAGHSFGGVLSVLMLAQHPEAAEAALVLDPVLFSPAMLGLMMTLSPLGIWQRNNSMSRRARRRCAHWPDRRAAWSYLHGRGMFGSWSDEALTAYIDAGLKPVHDGLALKCPPRREAEIFGTYPRKLWKSISQVQCPLHILYGECSYPFVSKSARSAVQTGQRITVEAIPGTHFFMQEEPALAAQALQRWLVSLG